MLNSKQRAKLRSLASTVGATTIIGKDGVTDTVIAQIRNELHARELVKVSTLDGCPLTAKECLTQIAEILQAEEVCSIGRKFVIYKLSDKKGIKHIEF